LVLLMVAATVLSACAVPVAAQIPCGGSPGIEDAQRLCRPNRPPKRLSCSTSLNVLHHLGGEHPRTGAQRVGDPV
jgi:hypothetical protein